MLPFLIQSATNGNGDIQCSVCNGLGTSADLDPRNKEYRVTITFGRLDQNPAGSNTDKISEDLAQDVSITGYKVYMTDQYGRVQGGELAEVPALYANKATKTCCNPTEYSVTVKGAQPSALQTMFFMVVPYQTIPASGDMSAKTFILPLGPVSDGVADVVGSATGPSAKRIPGSISFDAGGAAAIQALKNDLPKAFIIAARIIAESTPAEISASMIEILSILFSAAGGRRLQDGEKITINFEVFVPADSDTTFEASDIDSTTFTTRLAETVEEVLGETISVTSALTVDVQDPIPINVEQPTSAAFPRAKLPSSLMVFIIMLAGKQVLA
jgi:hypothetical protein